MLPAQQLTTSIQTHWASLTASEFETIYPGTRKDTNRLAAWCELWIEHWSDPPRRNADPDRLTLSILVHCFCRDFAQPVAVQRLVTTARAALARRTITMRDATAPVPIDIGVVRIREVAAHDLTRNHAALGQEHLQHIVLVFEARAEAFSSAA